MLRAIRQAITNRLWISRALKGRIVDQFHASYYEQGLRRGTWSRTEWMGVRTLKCPLDLWIYQEILHELRPDWIIETGTHRGGSALFLASVCDLIGHGRVLTVDVEQRVEKQHPRVEYLVGSSVAPEITEAIEARLSGAERIMVLLDSDHARDHVLQELEIYSNWVTLGSYLVVEDTNVNGHPVEPRFGPGPMEATQEFLQGHPEFEIDRSREKLLLTFNPGGFLRRAALHRGRCA